MKKLKKGTKCIVFAIIALFIMILPFKNTLKVHADEGVVTSETLEDISKDVIGDNKVIEWYEENKAVITLLCEAIVCVVASLAGTIITMRKVITGLKVLGDKKDDVIEEEKSRKRAKLDLIETSSKLDSLNSRIDVVISEYNELKEENKALRKELSGVRSAVSIAYTNDPNMQDGRAQAIAKVLSEE